MLQVCLVKFKLCCTIELTDAKIWISKHASLCWVFTNQGQCFGGGNYWAYGFKLVIGHLRVKGLRVIQVLQLTSPLHI